MSLQNASRPNEFNTSLYSSAPMMSQSNSLNKTMELKRKPEWMADMQPMKKFRQDVVQPSTTVSSDQASLSAPIVVREETSSDSGISMSSYSQTQKLLFEF